MMRTSSSQDIRPVAIPIADVLPWAIFGGLLMFMLIYFVGAEQGALSIFRALTSTNWCTMVAICSAFPVTDAA